MQDLIATWQSTTFVDAASEWVDEVLAQRGVQCTGELEPHKVRFWAAVFSAQTTAGRVWLKVANPGQGFEGALLQSLGQLRPDEVMTPMAVNAERGWWLLPDGGPTLREIANSEAVWVDLLRQVAGSQKALAHEGVSLAMVPRLSARDAPSHLASLIDDLALRPDSDAQAITAREAATLSAGLSTFGADMALLDALGIPDTLQINDVHLGNACGPAHDGGPFRLFDLGDAFWSHPFAVLHLPLRVAVGLGLADPLPREAAQGTLTSTYLELWPEISRDQWLTVLAAADKLGALHRAASWTRLLREVDPQRLGMPPPTIADWVRQALA